MSNKTEATFYDGRKPCRGINTNVCVAEGCFNEACLTVGNDDPKPVKPPGDDPRAGREMPKPTRRSMKQKAGHNAVQIQISGQHSSSNDFPVGKTNRFSGHFSGLKRFFGQDSFFRSFVLYLTVIGLMAGLAGLVIFTLPVIALGWWGALTLWPLISLILALQERK